MKVKKDLKLADLVNVLNSEFEIEMIFLKPQQRPFWMTRDKSFIILMPLQEITNLKIQNKIGNYECLFEHILQIYTSCIFLSSVKF